MNGDYPHNIVDGLRRDSKEILSLALEFYYI